MIRAQITIFRVIFSCEGRKIRANRRAKRTVVLRRGATTTTSAKVKAVKAVNKADELAIPPPMKK